MRLWVLYLCFAGGHEFKGVVPVFLLVDMKLRVLYLCFAGGHEV